MPADSDNPVLVSFFISDSFGRFKFRRHCLDNCINRAGNDDDPGRSGPLLWRKGFRNSTVIDHGPGNPGI